MARESDDRLLLICGYLAAIAAATIVLTMQLPRPDTMLVSVLDVARFVGGVAASIFGGIVLFERRYPVERRTAEVRSDRAD